jgi:hypothetical protein
MQYQCHELFLILGKNHCNLLALFPFLVIKKNQKVKEDLLKITNQASLLESCDYHIFLLFAFSSFWSQHYLSQRKLISFHKSLAHSKQVLRHFSFLTSDIRTIF